MGSLPAIASTGLQKRKRRRHLLCDLLKRFHARVCKRTHVSQHKILATSSTLRLTCFADPLRDLVTRVKLFAFGTWFLFACVAIGVLARHAFEKCLAHLFFLFLASTGKSHAYPLDAACKHCIEDICMLSHSRFFTSCLFRSEGANSLRCFSKTADGARIIIKLPPSGAFRSHGTATAVKFAHSLLIED